MPGRGNIPIMDKVIRIACQSGHTAAVQDLHPLQAI
jgi:hypothetical protein